MIFAEVLGGDLLDGGGGYGLVAGDVFGQVARIVEELVVAIEGVGDAAEATEALKADDLAGDVNGAGTVDFSLSGAVGLKACYFLPESGFEGVESDAGFGGNVTAGDGAQFERLEAAVDALGDLLLVDELAVETTGFAGAEDVNEEVGIGVTGGEDGRSQPCDREAGQLNGIGDGGALLSGNGRSFDRDGFDRGAFGDGAEVFSEERLQLSGVEVACDGDARVVGSVEVLVEVADVVDAGGFDVGMGADDGGVVGVRLGEEHVVDLLIGEVVGCAFALPTLVADDVALVGELDAVEAFEEEAHAVALEPESQFELIAGDGFEVVGAVEVGGAVDVGCACALEVFDVSFFTDVFGAFEHHVLEEMGEAGAAGSLVERADVIPEVNGYEREAVVFVHEDDETVGHDVLFVLQLRDFERLRWWQSIGGVGKGCEGETEEERRGRGAFGEEVQCFHYFSMEAGEVLGRVPAYSDR